MHIPVLLNEVIHHLEPSKGGWFFDGTLGEGGHTEALIEHGAKSVVAVDRDLSVVEFTTEKLKGLPLHAFHGSFDKIKEVSEHFPGITFSGILLDLGLSSRQLADEDRGFSFQKEGPLDMRMDIVHGHTTARDIVNNSTESNLEFIFTSYGEERYAKKISREIVKARKIAPIVSTKQLSSLISKAQPHNHRNHKIHPATKSFQAIRIAVNEELLILRNGLKEMISLLKLRGRIAVISFHSLEDKIVKETFKFWESEGLGKRITKKPIIATDEEISNNNRSRSAKLRIFEKNLPSS